MDTLYVIVAVIAGFLGAILLGRIAGFGRAAALERAAEAEAKRLIEAAQLEVEELRKAAQLEGRELAFRHKAEVEQEIRERKDELARSREELDKREREAERRRKQAQKREQDLARREQTMESRERAAESMVRRAEAGQQEAQARLEELAGLSVDQARQRLEESLRAEAREVVAEEIKAIEEEAARKAAEKSKEIIATAIQRYASEFVQERTVSVIPLPSDDMKGRLIGREGRNIRALEAASGVDMIIDDTSEVITISCFNPVRREIARRAISKLVADGRIHPTRIEEMVQKSEKEIDRACQEAGEQAVFDLGIHRVHPALVKQLGSLKFRTSYAHNVLHHSIEVGYLAGLMAAELGISVKAARRAGLLHDIGKAVDHKQEGTHAVLGSQLARKHGESPEVCQAIASHHDAALQANILDNIIAAANDLSNARPGARREVLASFVKRLEDLEEICSRFEGVSRAYALLAGREVRVLVQNERISDAQALMLAKEIARTIEDESIYAGQVRVVVLRETRASDYAR